MKVWCCSFAATDLLRGNLGILELYANRYNHMIIFCAYECEDGESARQRCSGPWSRFHSTINKIPVNHLTKFFVTLTTVDDSMSRYSLTQLLQSWLRKMSAESCGVGKDRPGNLRWRQTSFCLLQEILDNPRRIATFIATVKLPTQSECTMPIQMFLHNITNLHNEK